MENYLNEIEKIINDNFDYVINWKNEIIILENKFPDCDDITFGITKKNFLIIGINSINEFLLEEIIKLYYNKYFKLLKNETNYINYCDYELIKIEQIIKQNHDGSYDGFSLILEKVLGNITYKNIIEIYIKNNIQDIGLFKGKLKDINKFRNQLGHNSSYYFNNSQILYDVNKVNDDILILKKGFIELSKVYFESMNILLKIKI